VAVAKEEMPTPNLSCQSLFTIGNCVNKCNLINLKLSYSKEGNHRKLNLFSKPDNETKII